jgi:non-ribosomal peptide synthetase component E (peptide arylation enzyme)
MNLSDLMTTAASRQGDRTAIRQDGVSLPYTALERATALVAGLLRERDVQPVDRWG